MLVHGVCAGALSWRTLLVCMGLKHVTQAQGTGECPQIGGFEKLARSLLNTGVFNTLPRSST
jgi:hypothetical protein